MPLAFTDPGPGTPHFTEGAASFSFVVSQGLAGKDSLARRQRSSWQCVAVRLQPATVCYPETLVENSKIQFKSTGLVWPPSWNCSGRQCRYNLCSWRTGFSFVSSYIQKLCPELLHNHFYKHCVLPSLNAGREEKAGWFKDSLLNCKLALALDLSH